MATPILQGETGFRRYARAVERFPLLGREDELRLARRWRRRGDRRAAESLVESNLRFVIQIASRYLGYGIRLADLVEEGNLGLLQAVQRFDPERNLRFMTYAAFWIRAYVLSHVLKHWSIVGVGSSPTSSRMFFGLQRARAALVQARSGDSPEVDRQLAEEFGTSEERVRAMSQRLAARDTSLDVQAFREGGATHLELLADDGPDPEETVSGDERASAVRQALARAWPTLDRRERLILEQRLLRGDEGATLATLGRRLGLSRERVRQLEERLKLKLRGALSAVA